MLMQIIVALSWLAIPVVLLCVIDDWFFRPRRQIAALPLPASDPLFLKTAYRILPILVIAVVVRLLTADKLDFSLVLVIITVATGVLWLLDSAFLRKGRAKAALAAGKDPQAVPLPGTTDYARSFFPVAFVVLLLRAFVFEPFRIPSDSMMPTLLDGDFIIVNKYAYGLRMPVLNTKFMKIGDPQRGDVVVFRYPPDPSTNYIKRLVGLPGDRVLVRNDRLFVNGVAVQTVEKGIYDDRCYKEMSLLEEHLSGHVHSVLSCPEPKVFSGEPVAGCNRKGLPGYRCEAPGFRFSDHGGDTGEIVVPAGNYLMIGDNRDNSADGRVWGFVPDANIVGKASRIWLNLSFRRSGWVIWNRIGNRID